MVERPGTRCKCKCLCAACLNIPLVFILSSLDLSSIKSSRKVSYLRRPLVDFLILLVEFNSMSVRETDDREF
jgi:hypothetical protein